MRPAKSNRGWILRLLSRLRKRKKGEWAFITQKTHEKLMTALNSPASGSPLERLAGALDYAIGAHMEFEEFYEYVDLPNPARWALSGMGADLQAMRDAVKAAILLRDD